MSFASDNTSGVAPGVLAALLAANEGHQPSYGHDALSARVEAQVRETFDAPQASVHLVATGTVANALSLSLLCPPWGQVLCHTNAHIVEDEGGAPEFYSHGARMSGIEGAHGRIAPEALALTLSRLGTGSFHNMQPAALSLTNLTEAGTRYDLAEVRALTALARARGLRAHMDGSRLANALAGTDVQPGAITHQSGIDILSLGGTKNGCMGVEAVVLFDPTLRDEFLHRCKRGGHVLSKQRFLAAQLSAWLENGLWLELAARANAKAKALADAIATLPEARLVHGVDANILFVEWPAAFGDMLRARGQIFYRSTVNSDPSHPEREVARLVTSWDSRDAEIDAFLRAAQAG